jgi:hypothetical protein
MNLYLIFLRTKSIYVLFTSYSNQVAEERKARQVLLERKEFLASLVLLEDQDVLEIPEPEVLVAKGEWKGIPERKDHLEKMGFEVCKGLADQKELEAYRAH